MYVLWLSLPDHSSVAYIKAFASFERTYFVFCIWVSVCYKADTVYLLPLLESVGKYWKQIYWGHDISFFYWVKIGLREMTLICNAALLCSLWPGNWSAPAVQDCSQLLEMCQEALMWAVFTGIQMCWEKPSIWVSQGAPPSMTKSRKRSYICFTLPFFLLVALSVKREGSLLTCVVL